MAVQMYVTTVQETGESNIFIFIIHCNYTSLWLVAQWHAFLFGLVFKDGFFLA